MRSPYDFYITPDEYEEAEKNGISRDLLTCRVRKLGWGKEVAMTKPPSYNATGWKNVKEIALKNGISYATYVKRIKGKWRLIDAISKPPFDRYQSLKLATQVNPKNQNKILTDQQAKIASLNGISYRTAKARIERSKWSIEEAITTPILTPQERGKRGKEASYWSEL